MKNLFEVDAYKKLLDNTIQKDKIYSLIKIEDDGEVELIETNSGYLWDVEMSHSEHLDDYVLILTGKGSYDMNADGYTFVEALEVCDADACNAQQGRIVVDYDKKVWHYGGDEFCYYRRGSVSRDLKRERPYKISFDEVDNLYSMSSNMPDLEMKINDKNFTSEIIEQMHQIQNYKQS